MIYVSKQKYAGFNALISSKKLHENESSFFKKRMLMVEIYWFHEPERQRRENNHYALRKIIFLVAQTRLRREQRNAR